MNTTMWLNVKHLHKLCYEDKNVAPHQRILLVKRGTLTQTEI
jgi:hypothetical protein